VPRPISLTVSPAEDKAERLAGMVARLWQKHGHRCSRSVLARALRFAECSGPGAEVRGVFWPGR
jgi:hypothetical protein